MSNMSEPENPNPFEPAMNTNTNEPSADMDAQEQEQEQGAAEEAVKNVDVDDKNENTEIEFDDVRDMKDPTESNDVSADTNANDQQEQAAQNSVANVFEQKDLDDLSGITDEDVRMGFLYAPHAFLGTPDTCIFHYSIIGTGPNADETTNVSVFVSPAGVYCKEGHQDVPQCSVSASKQTMLNILHGHTSVTMTIMCGELTVSDPVKMFSFGNAFRFVREDFFKFRDDYLKMKGTEKEKEKEEVEEEKEKENAEDKGVDAHVGTNAIVDAARAAAEKERVERTKKLEEVTLDVEAMKEYSDLHMAAFVIPF